MRNLLPTAIMVLGGVLLLFPVNFTPPDVIDDDPIDISYSPENAEEVSTFSSKLWCTFIDKVKTKDQHPPIDWVTAECEEIFEKPWVPFAKELSKILPLPVEDRNQKLDALKQKWFSSVSTYPTTER